jgi:hypothetical protein
MTMYVEYDPLGQESFVLKMPNDTIRGVRADFRASGAILGENEDGVGVYVFDRLLISMKEVEEPSSWSKGKPKGKIKEVKAG